MSEHREVRLSDIRSAWYRHPSHFELLEGMSGPERRHAGVDWRADGAQLVGQLRQPG